MTSVTKTLSTRFLIDVLTPFLPHIGENQLIKDIKITQKGKEVTLEYRVEEEVEVKLIIHK